MRVIQKNAGKLKKAGAAGFLERSALVLNGDGSSLLHELSRIKDAETLLPVAAKADG